MQVSDQSHAPAALPLGEKTGTIRTEGKVDPGACLNIFSEKKNLLFLLGFNPRTVQSVAQPLYGLFKEQK
jgi:hypothetical protein